jgi:hypothetical protein
MKNYAYNFISTPYERLTAEMEYRIIQQLIDNFIRDSFDHAVIDGIQEIYNRRFIICINKTVETARYQPFIGGEVAYRFALSAEEAKEITINLPLRMPIVPKRKLRERIKLAFGVLRGKIDIATIPLQ